MARATGKFFWVGATSTAYSTSDNWVDEAGTPWADGHYPGWDGALSANVNNDEVYFNQAATNACIGGDFSAKGTLAKFAVSRDYKKSTGEALGIGASDGYLVIAMTAGADVEIQAAAAGSIYLKGGGATGLQDVFIRGTYNTNRVYLDGVMSNVQFYKGNGTLRPTANISDSLMIAWMNTQASDVNLTIEAGATLPSVIECKGGNVTNSADLTGKDLQVSGGVWTNSAGDIDLCEVSGGTMIHNDGNITTLEVDGPGSYDGSQSSNPRTIGTARVNAGGTLNADDGVNSITFTNPIELDGGTFRVPAGTKLTVAIA